MGRDIGGTRATSETIGTILLVSVVVLLASVLFVAFADVVQPPDEPTQTYAIDTQETDDGVVITFDSVHEGDDLTVIADGLPIGTVTDIEAGDQFTVAGVSKGKSISLITRTKGGDERVVYRHEVSKTVPPEKPVLYLTGAEGTSYYAPSAFKPVPKPDHFDVVVAKDGSGDYTSIQSAVDNANSGDVIKVEQGVYYEEVWFQDEDANITLYAPNATLHTPGNPSDGITISHPSHITIIGLTIEGFTRGIFIDVSWRERKDYEFWDVTVRGQRTGIYVKNDIDDVTVRRSEFINNDRAFVYKAEGYWCGDYGCSPRGWEVTHNRFERNTYRLVIDATNAEQTTMYFEENWWGDTSPNEPSYQFVYQDGNVTADYEPYCTNENCTRLNERDTDSP